ncbi:unnamed protein product [Mesocestoides corti]|uniref:Tetraspanin n=1 Tax=Mesocestoides corti TaxID=53468 RepID=A0A3P6HRR1_MESCO|nr:unnamed protein product [Mesocestoides corti]
MEASGPDGFENVMDKMQQEMKCCGGVGPSDWRKPPASCCPDGKASCSDPHPVGCAQALHDVLESYTWAVAIFVILLCLIELGAIVSAFGLARKQTEAV